MLSAVVHRNHAARMEELSDGVLVTVPRRRPWWLAGPIRWMFSVGSERRVQLDALGSYVLSLCDGKRSVEDVIRQLMQRHQLSFQEARVSVMQFIKMLMERGVVGIEMKKK